MTGYFYVPKPPANLCNRNESGNMQLLLYKKYKIIQTLFHITY